MATVSFPGALTDAELYRLEQQVLDRLGAARALGEDTETLRKMTRVIEEVKVRRDRER